METIFNRETSVHQYKVLCILVEATFDQTKWFLYIL